MLSPRPPTHTLLFLREIKTAKANGASFLEPVTGLDPCCRSATWDVTRIAGNPFLNINSFTRGFSLGLTALTSDHIFASFPSSPRLNLDALFRFAFFLPVLSLPLAGFIRG